MIVEVSTQERQARRRCGAVLPDDHPYGGRPCIEPCNHAPESGHVIRWQDGDITREFCWKEPRKDPPGRTSGVYWLTEKGWSEVNRPREGGQS